MASEPILPVGFRELVRRFCGLVARRGILRLEEVPAVRGRTRVLPMNNDNRWPDKPIFDGGRDRAIPPLVGRGNGRLALPYIDAPYAGLILIATSRHLPRLLLVVGVQLF